MRSLTFVLLATCALAGCGRTTGTSATAPTPRPAGPPPDPTTVRFAAGPARFRLDASTNTVQEVMGNSQEIAFTQALLLSTALEAGPEIAFAITVDSVTVQGNVPGLDPATLSAARGQTFRARFTPLGGGLGVTTPDSTNPVMMQLGRVFRDFLPRLPSAPIAAGLTWVDTVTDTQQLPGGAGQTTTRSVRQSRIVGWEDREGVRALHIAVTGAFEVTGTGETQGQPLEISGTGQSAADRWVSAAGQYLGGSSRDSTNLTVNVLNMGMTIPIRQVQTATVTRVP